MKHEWKFCKVWEWGGVAYLGMEHEGSELNKGRKMDTCLELVRKLTGLHRGKCGRAVGEMQDGGCQCLARAV